MVGIVSRSSKFLLAASVAKCLGVAKLLSLGTTVADRGGNWVWWGLGDLVAKRSRIMKRWSLGGVLSGRRAAVSSHVRVAAAKLLRYRAIVGYLLHLWVKFGDKTGDSSVTITILWALRPDTPSSGTAAEDSMRTHTHTPTPRVSLRELSCTPPRPHTKFSPYSNLITTLKDITC